MTDDIVTKVYAREQVKRAEAAVEQRQLEGEKREAVEKVYAAAREAAGRLAEDEWPQGFTCRVDGAMIVLTSIKMKQPLFLGSDGMVYRREEASGTSDGFRTFPAPLMQRKRPSDILHIIKFLNRLGN